MSWLGWGAFAALGIIWGVPYFFIKVSVQELSPAVVAFGRVTLGALVLLPIAWRRGALRSLLGSWLATRGRAPRRGRSAEATVSP